MLPARPIRSWASLVLRSLVLLLPLFGAVWQTSCWVYYEDCDDDDGDYCDDDDDDFDDDDDGNLTGPGLPSVDTGALPSLSIAAPDLRLRTFESIPAEAGSAHPARRIVAIEGIAIGTPAALERPGEAAFREFTWFILFQNQDLLGLPPAAGRWVFDAVEYVPDVTRVLYRQEFPPLVQPLLRGDSAGTLAFVFDRRGSLVEIDDSSRLLFD